MAYLTEAQVKQFDEEGYLLPEVVYGWTDIERLVNV